MMLRTILWSLLLFAIVGPVRAQWYAGMGLGILTNQVGSGNALPAPPSSGIGTPQLTSSTDNRKMGSKVFAGYKLNQTWAAELGYGAVGKFQRKQTSASAIPLPCPFPPSTYCSGAYTVISTSNLDQKVAGWTLVGIGSLSVNESFSAFVKAGLFASTTSSASSSATVDGISVSVPSYTAIVKTSSVVLGAGVQFNITKSLGLRAEYENYGRVGNDFVGRSKPEMWSANLVYQF
jgi:OOP family OmpA-OmpF porin